MNLIFLQKLHMTEMFLIDNIYHTIHEDKQYYHCNKRQRWIPCRNTNKELNKTRFFIDDNILTYDQISDFDFYRNTVELYLEYEEWKVWSEFPEYEFSNLGRMKLKNGAISIRIPGDDGYVKVVLKHNENRRSISLHRVIAMLFCNNDDQQNKIEVDHINGIRHDNRSINLRWLTHYQNNIDKVFASTCSGEKTKIVVYQLDVNFNQVRKWNGNSEIVAEFTKNDTIYYNLDTNRLYLGYYWYREKPTLLPGEEFRILYVPEVNTTLYVSNMGRFCNQQITNGIYNRISYGNMMKNGYMRTSLGGKEYKVHQLVLMAFNPIDNSNNLYVPDHIDGSKTNNKLENLTWKTFSQNTNSYLETLTEEQREEKQNVSTTSRRIKITCTTTNETREYDSIAEGDRAGYFTKSQLKSVLSGLQKSIYKDNMFYNVEYLDQRKDRSDKYREVANKSISEAVIQYDKNMNEIARYPSVSEASRQTKISGKSIHKYCKEPGNDTYGFIWRYVNSSDNVPSTTREVVKLSQQDYSFIEQFQSIADAVRATGVSDSTITSNCKGNTVTAGGFKWMYREEYIHKIKTFMEENLAKNGNYYYQQSNWNEYNNCLSKYNEYKEHLHHIEKTRNVFTLQQ